MSERDRMWGTTSGKGDTPRPCDLKKFRERYPKGMGKKAKNPLKWLLGPKKGHYRKVYD